MRDIVKQRVSGLILPCLVLFGLLLTLLQSDSPLARFRALTTLDLAHAPMAVLLPPIVVWSESGSRPASQVQKIVQRENRSLPQPVGRKISEQILNVAEEYDIDPLLILAVIKTESNFRPKIVSYAGAIGLMQVKPIVVREVGDANHLMKRSPYSLLTDPEMNIEIGVRYLDYLRKRFGNDWFHILSAYNMGPTFVDRLQRRQRLPPNRYYRKVMRAYHTFRRNTVSETT